MCSQRSVSAIGVESSHLKLWCGRGSETTAAAAPCREEATSHSSWTLSHSLDDLPGLSINPTKNSSAAQWLYSTRFKIWGHFWEITLPFFSPSFHPSCLSHTKKKKKKGKEEWRNYMLISVSPKILVLFWLDHQRRDIVYEYFKMCIVLCGLVEPRWWKCLFA